MRSAILILFSSIELCVFAQNPQAVNAYVERYKSVAIEEMKAYGIPASITLAQGIHESGCGNSSLALNSNNHFGIKCHEEWSGRTYHHDDDAPQECFRVYACPEESFRDHSEFLKNRPRYAKLFTLSPTDYKSWAKGLKAAGYATNPHYTDIIVHLIEDYDLSQYDHLQSPIVAAKSLNNDSSEIQIIKTSLSQKQTTAKSSNAASFSEPVLNTRPAAPLANSNTFYTPISERIVNGLKAVIYENGLSMQFISTKYHVAIEDLYTFNDLSPSDKIKTDELIYLEEKKNDCVYYQYEVSAGETMRDIAQKFGIKLTALYSRNQMPGDAEPLSGEIVVLRGNREVPIKFRSGAHFNQAKFKSVPENSSSAYDSKLHTVADSETLYSISRQYNIPVDTLMKINGLKGEDIKIGQTLIVSL